MIATLVKLMLSLMLSIVFGISAIYCWYTAFKNFHSEPNNEVDRRLRISFLVALISGSAIAIGVFV